MSRPLSQSAKLFMDILIISRPLRLFKKLFISIMMISLLLIVEGGPIAYEEPTSISLIDDGPQGNFFIVSGIKLAPDSVNLEVNGSSLSYCRTVCFAVYNCKEFSLAQQNDVSLKACYLSTSEGVHHSKYNEDVNSIHAFKIGSIPGKNRILMEDKNYYVLMYWNYSPRNGRYYCARAPGFRLGIFKTQQEYETLVKLSQINDEEFWIDLMNVDGQLMWGDGTPLGNIEQAGVGITVSADSYGDYYYLGTDLVLYGVNDSIRSSILCQANHVILN